jgi:hypothetical protein
MSGYKISQPRFEPNTSQTRIWSIMLSQLARQKENRGMEKKRRKKNRRRKESSEKTNEAERNGCGCVRFRGFN